MRRYVIIGLVALVLIAGGVFALVVLPNLREGGPGDQQQLRRAQAEKGDITITISAAGSVEPEQISDLVFASDRLSPVEVVRVDVGDRVTEGQVLAELETATLQIARDQASLNYDIQDLSKQKLVDPPDDNDLAGARAAVSAASARMSDVQNPDPEEVEIARLEAEQALKNFKRAERHLKGVQVRVDRNEENVAIAESGNAWVQAQMAVLEYQKLANGPTPQDLAVSAAEVAVAAAELRQAEALPTELEIEQADLELQRRQIAIELAEQDLADATLRAPFDGVVAAVNLEEGTPPSSLEPAITLVDDGQFHIDVEVDEIDIGQVEVGQTAFIELDALPEFGLRGTVTNIAPSASTEEGDVVSYIVRVDLEPTDAPLLSGMTATVDIAVEELTSVLRIPNWAIRIDRRTGDTFVNILGPDEGLLEVKVELGLRGDAYSQVVSGLDEEQEVVLDLEREQISFFGGGEE